MLFYKKTSPLVLLKCLHLILNFRLFTVVFLTVKSVFDQNMSIDLKKCEGWYAKQHTGPSGVFKDLQTTRQQKHFHLN